MNLLIEAVSVDQALESWRFAAQQVGDAWQHYLAADRPSVRREAFAAYVAALDLEADAADELFAIAGTE
ncbi:hypothetical protein OM076_29265 [Solirubrobacter ginsenosidimutans]|uniref:Uncharacterized protein n=1 Tax=Solirubrobacter ginsenosidimutans TaxID=490573 RepID=A0A9X3MZA6_9ACTN|nr:hypothetical protein [Solirubrobacter ginsenosidimutans]MDA0164396.1 hypothetical protein [Solirubrobacter ginsenosidimutans]